MLRGKRLADECAKKGSLLRGVKEEHILLVEACESRVDQVVRWQGRLHAWLHDRSLSDTDQLGGTAYVQLDLDIGLNPADPALDEQLDRLLSKREAAGIRICSSDRIV